MSESVAPAQFTLPPAVVGRSELARLAREVEAIDNELEAQKARTQGSSQAVTYRMPTMSRGLGDFLDTNKIDLADDRTRMALKEQLRVLKEHAPIIHLTFATDADPESLRQLTGWVRQQIHPQALLSIGLQPALVGGVYVRTPNHVHDLSLKRLMADKRNVIVQALEKVA